MRVRVPCVQELVHPEAQILHKPFKLQAPCLYSSVRSATSGTVSFKPSMKAAALSTSGTSMQDATSEASEIAEILRFQPAQFLELGLLAELPASGC